MVPPVLLAALLDSLLDALDSKCSSRDVPPEMLWASARRGTNEKKIEFIPKEINLE